MKTWYHEMGFYKNPLSTKPAAFHDDVLGYEEKYKEIKSKISQDSIVGFFGAYGTGKSTVLKKIIRDFGGRKNVIYYSCSKSDNPIDFDRLIRRAGNILQRLFRIRKKGLIILLDEAELIGKRDIDNLMDMKDHFKSIVFVGKEPTIRVKELLDYEFDFSSISPEKAVELIRSRIGNLDIISDDTIKNIFQKDKNPRRFIKNCENAIKEAYNKGSVKRV
jgi:ATPase family associated with various cellular activities (AAA).